MPSSLTVSRLTCSDSYPSQQRPLRLTNCCIRLKPPPPLQRKGLSSSGVPCGCPYSGCWEEMTPPCPDCHAVSLAVSWIASPYQPCSCSWWFRSPWAVVLVSQQLLHWLWEPHVWLKTSHWKGILCFLSQPSLLQALQMCWLFQALWLAGWRVEDRIGTGFPVFLRYL